MGLGAILSFSMVIRENRCEWLAWKGGDVGDFVRTEMDSGVD